MFASQAQAQCYDAIPYKLRTVSPDAYLLAATAPIPFTAPQGVNASRIVMHCAPHNCVRERNSMPIPLQQKKRRLDAQYSTPGRIIGSDVPDPLAPVPDLSPSLPNIENIELDCP